MRGVDGVVKAAYWPGRCEEARDAACGASGGKACVMSMSVLIARLWLHAQIDAKISTDKATPCGADALEIRSCSDDELSDDVQCAPPRIVLRYSS